MITEDEMRFIISVVRNNRSEQLRQEVAKKIPCLKKSDEYLAAINAYFTVIQMGGISSTNMLVINELMAQCIEKYFELKGLEI